MTFLTQILSLDVICLSATPLTHKLFLSTELWSVVFAHTILGRLM